MMGAERILVVEDEPKIAALLADYLRNEGFDVTIESDGVAAVEAIRSQAPTLVLLDLMLPHKDGLSVCREVRQFSNVPIIMVTARIEEIDRLLGLELGADDYICKPFSPREVVARVKAILRRIELTHTKTDGYRGLRLDEARHEAILGEQTLDLTPVEFRLLALLAERPGIVFSRDQLVSRIYTDGRVVSDRTVDSHIKNLRRKLTEIAGDDDYVHSVYGVGYKFE
ncbi:MAG: response regulator [Pseudomonadota bacterium]